MYRAQRGDKQGPTGSATATIQVGADGQRRIDAAELLGADREVVILYADRAYRLQETATGKLILTK